MKQQVKRVIKKNIPARYLELFSTRAVAITKIPNKGSVISDFFIFRCENGWETFFECLDFDRLLNAESHGLSKKLQFCFYSKNGHFIAEKEVVISSTIKSTLLINKIASDLKINQDGLFTIFHPQKELWISKNKSFLAERGYIGYANAQKGLIKGYVNGNLDAIARSGVKTKDQLLGNYSFFKKEYHLQHCLESSYSYELFLVNPTTKKQSFTVVEYGNDIKKTKLSIPSKGMYMYTKAVYKNASNSTIIIESKLYLARPVVFKIMPSSFDVFHG